MPFSTVRFRLDVTIAVRLRILSKDLSRSAVGYFLHGPVAALPSFIRKAVITCCKIVHQRVGPAARSQHSESEALSNPCQS